MSAIVGTAMHDRRPPEGSTEPLLIAHGVARIVRVRSLSDGLAGYGCTASSDPWCFALRDGSAVCMSPELTSADQQMLIPLHALSAPLESVSAADLRTLAGDDLSPRRASNHGAECRIAAAGSVRCDGFNLAGQAGGISGEQQVEAARVRGLPLDVPVRELHGGDVHFCAVDTARAVHCWGHGAYGQLGDGGFESRGEAARVRELPPVHQLSVGLEHACALDAEGGVWCWGHNEGGQVGDASHMRVAVPFRVPVPPLVEVHANGASSCGRTAEGDVYCWGSHIGTQLCA